MFTIHKNAYDCLVHALTIIPVGSCVYASVQRVCKSWCMQVFSNIHSWVGSAAALLQDEL
jgi:hypothetical protein